MVNVGGRSKGCSTCRRRRVKCDENRPICLRCQRGGLECDGPKDLTFVDATIVASRRRAEHPPSASTPVVERSSNAQIIRPSASLGNPQEMYIMFTRSRLTPSGPVDMALRELQSSDITQLQANRTMDCRTSHLRAVLSFATILFGTEHKEPSITRQGFLSHGATLKQLNRVLSEPSCYKYDEVIVSVTTLAIQETLVPSGPMLFLNHMLGLEKLLELRDPRSYCSPKTVDLYKCLRYMLLFASLRAGRPSILAKPEWKEMLRQSCVSEEGLQEQQLYDVLANCSVFAFERDELLKRWEDEEEDTRDNQVSNIRASVQESYDQLQTWRAQWDANPANSYIETPTTMTSSNTPEELANDVALEPPSDIVFPTISSTLTLMLYNVTLINILKILVSLPLGSQQQSLQGDYIAALHSAVLEVYRSMPYASNAELQKELHTAPVVHWATQIAQTALQGDESVEAVWLANILDRKSAKVFVAET